MRQGQRRSPGSGWQQNNNLAIKTKKPTTTNRSRSVHFFSSSLFGTGVEVLVNTLVE